ncbi:MULTISPECIES: Rz1-like spanin outer membrane subunit [unclassified Pseudomonas]|uniref:Rz1-like spanin outer membrane subunit n=1 Tax=unclassified Pseudomonas TaxID=196821 RepID=UPI0035317C40
MKNLKRLWPTYQSNGKSTWLRSRLWLRGLLIGCVLTVSACASSLPTQQCVQSQVTVDPSLMVTPTYQQTLLDSLSSKPNEQTTK